MIVSRVIYASCCFGLTSPGNWKTCKKEPFSGFWGKVFFQRSLIQTQTFTVDDVSTTERRPHAFETDTRSLPRR